MYDNNRSYFILQVRILDYTGSLNQQRQKGSKKKIEKNIFEIRIRIDNQSKLGEIVITTLAKKKKKKKKEKK